MPLYKGTQLISGLRDTSTLRNLGQIVQSTIPLNDAGLHLLDGSVINGNGIYSAFCDYIADLYTNSPKSSNILRVGNVVDNDGVLSGFSASNYAKLPSLFNPLGNTWEIVFKITTGSSVSGEQYIFASQVGTTLETRFGIRIIIIDGKIAFSDTTSGTSWDVNAVGTTTLATNTTYWVKAVFNGSSRIISISTDGETYTQEASVSLSSASANFNVSYIGAWNNGSILSNLQASIDLNESYININGSRWWTGRMPSGFVEEVTWQAYVTTYGVCGKFVYDSVAGTVRLPKITGFIEGAKDVTELGNLVEAGLPNITGSFNLGSTGLNTGMLGHCGGSGAFSGTETGSATYVATRNSSASSTNRSWDFDASRSSLIYGNSNTVQPQAIKVFYYIVVATVAKLPIEVDIDNVATDLNGKADVDLTNVNATGTATMTKMSMPSSRKDTLVLGATGSTYIAPANGWFVLAGNDSVSTQGAAVMRRVSDRMGTTCGSTYGTNMSSGWLNGSLPVKKGAEITIFYTGFSASAFNFFFVYAEGN